MILKFKTKNPLRRSDITKFIGSDGEFFYTIENVVGMSYGEKIDAS